MERSVLSHLKGFYDSAPGLNIAKKIIDCLEPKTHHGQALIMGFGNRFLDKLPEENLLYAIPEGYEIIRWPKLRPFRTVVVDEQKLPFAPECFDVVIAAHVLEYNHHPGAFLKEVSRILKKDGNLVVVSINKQCLVMDTKSVRYSLNDQLTFLNAHNFQLRQICYINNQLHMYDCSDIFKYIFLRSISFLFNVVILDVIKKSNAPELVVNFQEKYGMA